MLIRIGPYNLIKKIASGVMATVCLATHGKTNEKLAIKFLKEELSSKEKILDRFTQEGLLKLDHPNIIKVHSVGSFNNTPYIVMDYIEGTDLEELIKKEDKLPLDKTIQIFAPRCFQPYPM